MTVYRHQGRWLYDFQKDGRRQREGGFLTKQEAKNAETDARRNLNKTNSDFIELCESRLKDIQTRRTPKYFKENHQFIKNLILIWSPLKEVTRQDVEFYLNEVANKSHFVANKQLRFIKALFNHGLDRDMISHNPAAKINQFSVDKRKKYIPSDEDIQKVLSLATALDRLYLLVIAHTLGRITAVNQLRWDDVSFEESYVSLYTRQARNSDRKEVRIPMNSVLEDTLRSIEKKGDYVFINHDTGKPYGYRSKFLKTLCRKAGVRVFTYHALRHYGASKLDNAGVALTDIQTLLGHEKVTTTALYLQSLRGSVKTAVKKLEGIK